MSSHFQEYLTFVEIIKRIVPPVDITPKTGKKNMRNRIFDPIDQCWIELLRVGLSPV